ncbi:low molecular weight protein-tyrosine-phosphatase [Piscinibacter sp.]|uniref:low molecular weight protein-tyrosine-phosphatase n=1 Tax=Piscinibacter sp. TaxID=1903157 RepID=UPI002BBD37FA|nr:low molecular weight protein-tyrosine-phosphatase [Albitalea sp.]HUG21119.1 low molecular weight protein-tyrosine-phosphatase [Albitalea sp.]
MTARRVLMVCMGNICRSPTAEAVLRHKLREAGLDHVVVDSAGTHAYHVGDPPDPRSTRHASRRGYDLSALRARKVCRADFEQFDLVLAMDWENLELLGDQCPAEHRGKLRRLTEFARRLDAEIVPDPYYSGADGFEHVLDIVEDACEGLVAHLLAAPHQTGGTS